MGLALLFPSRAALAQESSGMPGVTAANVPVLASGQLPSVTPTGEEVPPNALGFNLFLGANYDDNARPGVTPRQWDVFYSVLPRISLEETRSRIVWSVAYTPGIELSQQLLYRNQFAQRFAGTVAWRTSPHGTLSAQEYYLVTTNPFSGFSTTEPGPTIAPNESIFVPNLRQTLTLSHAMYSYQSSAKITMGFGGTFQLQKYDSVPHSGPSTSAIHSQIASGQAFIARQFTARNQLGLQYSGQVLRFPQADARTTTHSFSVFDQMNVSSRTSITLYAGPEYSLISNEVVLNLGFVVISIPVKSNQWSASGGAMFNWRGDRLATSIDFSRRVSEGGGLIGAVELTEGSAELVWQLARDWSLTSSIAGASDQLLGVSSGPNELKTYSGQFGVRRQLGRNLALQMFYRRLNETGSINGLVIGNRDIAGVTLEYSFLKPLGG